MPKPAYTSSHFATAIYSSAEFLYPTGRLSFRVGAWLTEEEQKLIRESVHGAGEWVYSGGVRIPFGSTSRWAIDIGLRYHHGGTASYLADGGIQRNPDGSINSVNPIRSQTPFVMYMLGVQFRPSIQ